MGSQLRWLERGFCALFCYLLTMYLFSAIALATNIPVEQPGHAVNCLRNAVCFDSTQIAIGETQRLQSESPQSLDTQELQEDTLDTFPGTLPALLDALEVMQSHFYKIWQGTWPDAIDWTAAVLGTHVSATLSTLTSSIDYIISPASITTAGGSTLCFTEEVLAYENLINRYFSQTSAFYFGENAFSLRNQAFDDMLWVVLGWLENIKFMNLHSALHYPSSSSTNANISDSPWHGTQFSAPAAHRARLFYELASQGWDTSLCRGGMVWSPYLTPYKNAITNELFISASVSMYLYFPGDDNDSPFGFQASGPSLKPAKPHDPAHLEAAIKAYKWLSESNMTTDAGLFADGFHIRGWHRNPSNGTEYPGTGNCDVLNEMVYTYNQGVLLSGLRGLWITTGARSYVEDGHWLVDNVIKATGWQSHDGKWNGLGRDGVLEEACDSSGHCSQNGHTFKGIFFHHLAEFCRPVRPDEEEFISSHPTSDGSPDRIDFDWHSRKCASYTEWIAHNARAAYITRDKKGKFGMWWGREYGVATSDGIAAVKLPEGAVDYRNDGVPSDPGWTQVRRKRDARYEDEDKESSRQIQHYQDFDMESHDVNDRGRGRTVETQSGGVAVLRALWQWETLVGRRS